MIEKKPCVSIPIEKSLLEHEIIRIEFRFLFKNSTNISLVYNMWPIYLQM